MQKGFAPILIILLLAAAIGGIYLVREYNKSRLGDITFNTSVLPPSSNPTDQTANWKTYEDKIIGFTIKHPQDWWVKRTNEGIVIFGKLPEPKEIPVLIDGWWGLSITDNHVLWDLNKKRPVGDDTEYESITFSEQPAKKFVIALEDGSSTTRIIFNTSGKGWTVDFPNNTDGSSDPIYNKILSTFKFLDENVEGRFCGGIAANLPENQCPSGYKCQLSGNYPDASGKCVKR